MTMDIAYGIAIGVALPNVIWLFFGHVIGLASEISRRVWLIILGVCGGRRWRLQRRCGACRRSCSHRGDGWMFGLGNANKLQIDSPKGQRRCFCRVFCRYEHFFSDWYQRWKRAPSKA